MKATTTLAARAPWLLNSVGGMSHLHADGEAQRRWELLIAGLQHLAGANTTRSTLSRSGSSTGARDDGSNVNVGLAEGLPVARSLIGSLLDALGGCEASGPRTLSVVTEAPTDASSVPGTGAGTNRRDQVLAHSTVGTGTAGKAGGSVEARRLTRRGGADKGQGQGQGRERGERDAGSTAHGRSLRSIAAHRSMPRVGPEYVWRKARSGRDTERRRQPFSSWLSWLANWWSGNRRLPSGWEDMLRKNLALTSCVPFIPSPAGNGWQSHRTWETLFAGSIPVVAATGSPPMDGVHAGLPVIVVKDWEQAAQLEVLLGAWLRLHWVWRNTRTWQYMSALQQQGRAGPQFVPTRYRNGGAHEAVTEEQLRGVGENDLAEPVIAPTDGLWAWFATAPDFDPRLLLDGLSSHASEDANSGSATATQHVGTDRRASWEAWHRDAVFRHDQMYLGHWLQVVDKERFRIRSSL